MLNLNNYISFILVFILPFSLRVVDDTIKFKEDKNQDKKFYNASSFHKLKYKRHNKIINNNKKEVHTSKTSSYDFNSNTGSDTPDDLKSRLKSDQISKLSKKDKKLMGNTNTYIELNTENSVNYALDTDVK